MHSKLESSCTMHAAPCSFSLLLGSGLFSLPESLAVLKRSPELGKVALVIPCHQHDRSLCGQHLKLVHEHIPHCLLTSALPELCITKGTHPSFWN